MFAHFLSTTSTSSYATVYFGIQLLQTYQRSGLFLLTLAQRNAYLWRRSESSDPDQFIHFLHCHSSLADKIERKRTSKAEGQRRFKVNLTRWRRAPMSRTQKGKLKWVINLSLAVGK